jgi:hypothetical protein
MRAAQGVRIGNRYAPPAFAPVILLGGIIRTGKVNRTHCKPPFSWQTEVPKYSSRSLRSFDTESDSRLQTAARCRTNEQSLARNPPLRCCNDSQSLWRRAGPTADGKNDKSHHESRHTHSQDKSVLICSPAARTLCTASN